MGYFANSSMRFAIRRLSSGQRSFKLTMPLALLGSEDTWKTDITTAVDDTQQLSPVYTDLYVLFLVQHCCIAIKREKMADLKKYLPFLHQHRGK